MPGPAGHGCWWRSACLAMASVGSGAGWPCRRAVGTPRPATRYLRARRSAGWVRCCPLILVARQPGRPEPSRAQPPAATASQSSSPLVFCGLAGREPSSSGMTMRPVTTCTDRPTRVIAVPGSTVVGFIAASACSVWVRAQWSASATTPVSGRQAAAATGATVSQNFVASPAAETSIGGRHPVRRSRAVRRWTCSWARRGCAGRGPAGDGLPGQPSRTKQLLRNRIYWVCAIVILACVVAAVVTNFLPASLRPNFPWLFLYEAVGVFAFGVSSVRGRPDAERHGTVGR